MSLRKSITGRRFGKLVAIVPAGRNRSGETLWLCRCDCGRLHFVRHADLTAHNTQSCGCLRNRPCSRQRLHGMTDTPEFRAYTNARRRCTNPKTPGYKNWGGRGIKFLFESFAQFYAEVGPRPSPEHSLDRRDNDGHYAPGNIRWATPREQTANRRKAVA